MSKMLDLNRKFFHNKYTLEQCYANPSKVNPMNIHLYELMEKQNELLEEIRDGLKEDKNAAQSE